MKITVGLGCLVTVAVLGGVIGAHRERRDISILSVDEFLLNFNKIYDNEAEKNKRIEIFKFNVKAMEDHNKLYEYGQSSYKMGVNEYSDMTYKEVIARHTDIFAPHITERHKISDDWYVPTQLRQTPEYMDYRAKGAVNPIRNQGTCESSWAYSITSSIESNIFLKKGSLPQLSEQDLIDCSSDYGTKGCEGGWPADALKYVIAHGISYRNEYPSTGTDDTCNKPATQSNDVISYQKVRPGKEDDLLDALVHIGPISISMFVSDNFCLYTSGVLNDSYCTDGGSLKVNHALTLVGYGTEKGLDYWLLRNSWGPKWGVDGYIKVARNRNNHCLISSHGVIPIIQAPPPRAEAPTPGLSGGQRATTPTPGTCELVCKIDSREQGDCGYGRRSGPPRCTSDGQCPTGQMCCSDACVNGNICKLPVCK